MSDPDYCRARAQECDDMASELSAEARPAWRQMAADWRLAGQIAADPTATLIPMRVRLSVQPGAGAARLDSRFPRRPGSRR